MTKGLRIDDQTHLAIKRLSVEAGISMNTYLRQVFVGDREREALEDLEKQLEDTAGSANPEQREHGTQPSNPPPQP